MALQARHRGDADTLIVEEMGVWSGSVRVDMAVINGELHGVELKSERDTLSRLPTQAKLYSLVFDKMTLVVAEKHRAKAEAIVPTWWGITAAVAANDGLVVLRKMRNERSNPSLDPIQIARLLWKEERLTILERRGLIKGLRSANSEKLCQSIVDLLSLDDLRLEARRAFKVRNKWLGKALTD